MNKTTLLAGVLWLALPWAPAAAGDDYDDHARDHHRHYRFHDRAAEVHERAHEDGFYSRREHPAFHRALRYLHRDFHDEHPNTWHDH
jgi:hypothetical protein